MLLSTINTWLLFSLICKKRTIPRGNTVSCKIYIAWDYEELYPFLLAIFLSDRTFQIHLGIILSDKIFHPKEGVPQGAILSTTLFNIKINDIVKQVDPSIECSLYVDDFVIMYRSPTINAI